jgi:hypothetical protein
LRQLELAALQVRVAKNQAAQGFVLQVPQVAQRAVECSLWNYAASVYPGLIVTQQDYFPYQCPLPEWQSQQALLRTQWLLPALAYSPHAKITFGRGDQLFSEGAFIEQPIIGIGGQIRAVECPYRPPSRVANMNWIRLGFLHRRSLPQAAMKYRRARVMWSCAPLLAQFLYGSIVLPPDFSYPY